MTTENIIILSFLMMAALVSYFAFRHRNEKPTEPLPDRYAWLEQYSWKSTPALAEWASRWEEPLHSDLKALFKIVEVPETEPKRFYIPRRTRDFQIARNSLGGIEFEPGKGFTAKAPPFYHENAYPNGVWGFYEQLKAGSEADGGRAVVVIGDSATPGHEFYVLPVHHVELVGVLYEDGFVPAEN